MSNTINICLCGFRGYAGKELINLVLSHPYLKLVGVLARKTDDLSYITHEWGSKQSISVYTLQELVEQRTQIDLLLLATPPEASIECVATLKNSGIKIIDLSGAFRLPQDELQQWYGIEHHIPELLNGASYGLSPWGVKNYENQTLIANPGCYATCALMSLIPLLQHDIIENKNIIIDAKSGTSGAGKKANSDLMFCEVAENFFPYRVGQHQHIPEINNTLSRFTNKSCNVTFVTQLLPIMRGIAMSIYADATPHFNSDKQITAAIEAAYQTAYADYALIQFGAINQGNSAKDKWLLSLKTVVGTPNSHVAYFVDAGKVCIFACIDNLLKGAASQAIENVNALYQLPLATGLLDKADKI